jgi:hypothetical protein
MLPRVQESVKEWTLTLSNEFPFWELESQWTLEFLEGNYRGQNSMDWKVLYIIENLLERRCLKWARMTHLGTKIQIMAKRRTESQIANLTPDH